MIEKRLAGALLAALFLSLDVASPAWAEDEKFDIQRYSVEGNTLLTPAEMEALVGPYTGQGRVYGDVQKALTALEDAYRSRGYGAVQVFVPEQELGSGVIRLQVIEASLGKVVVTGNSHFSTENIRASLPQLQEGTSPNLRQISENVQLANENPAKKVEVTLGTSEQEGQVDAKVAVVDDNPRQFVLSLDNTGDTRTGQYRLGAAYRDSNLFGHDETLTLGYTTAPGLSNVGPPSGVDVDVLSAGLRIPFYRLGDSLDVVWGRSSVNMPASVVAPGGALALNGKGEIIALRWNHLLPRAGEYSSRWIFGFDQKDLKNPCNGGLVNAGCVALLERIVSATYTGNWQKPGMYADFNAGLFYNTGLGEKQDDWRYDYAANARSTNKNFWILKGGGSYLQVLPGDWQVRGVLNAQYADSPLPASEQLSLTGYSAVRGFSERILTADSGFVANLEAYTPDLIPAFNLSPEWGSLRALVFYDFAYGWSRPQDSVTWYDGYNRITVPAGLRPLNERTNIASLGLGLRYTLAKNLTARFDWACIQQSAPASRLTPNVPVDSDWRVHFGISYAF
ncbi:MAG: ShlB/FhaC/HecB family hemolysin secretion/activation protein [Proteobacteria bacterium]|nr:ShlB/FhaC/HecB family hemolysin secretion/activation protein [Pseudomonadota bacterium]HQR05145.1 ShlB/FhaC/HecB family hemolysin secretion/activation protein [Rhodocyclaceae bacterium]